MNEDNDKQFKVFFNTTIDKLLNKVLKAEQPSERDAAITKLRKFVEKCLHYDWYYRDYTSDKTNEEIAKLVNSNKVSAFPHEDVYFRKANFVYAFFSPYLVNESCVVTKDMVNELVHRCELILAKAHEDGWVNKNGKLIEKLGNYHSKYEWEEVEAFMEKLPRRWVEVAEEQLPTQSGFFFGSTDYNHWYLYDIKSCVNQFKKLMRTWKDDEVVYNYMSW